MMALTAAIDHDGGVVLGAGLLDGRCSSLYVLLRIVWTLGTTAEDDMNVLVSASLDDRGDALLGHAHEGVRIRGRAHGVDGDGDAAVGPVFEPDGEGDT